MDKRNVSRPYLSCLAVFSVCGLARLFEYFILRTDETVVSEDIFHKLFGIAVLLAVLKMTGRSMKDLGFTRGLARPVGKGLLLGLCCFGVSYLVEIMLLLAQGKSPHLDFYAAGFSLNGAELRQRTLLAVVLCVVFNVVNVIMEEGVFRGLFISLTEPAGGFAEANLFAALLFGVWHWVMPLRSFIDDEMSLGGLIVMGVGYVILAGVMSIKWGLWYKMTGCLWVGLGDHLFNNVVATNLVHVVANGEADSLQIVRILTAQLISFGITLYIYKKSSGSNSASQKREE